MDDEPEIAGLDEVAAGLGGGPIDVLFAPVLGLGFVIDIDGVLPFAGVPVLGVELADVAADNCFVGDFVGDY